MVEGKRQPESIIEEPSDGFRENQKNVRKYRRRLRTLAFWNVSMVFTCLDPNDDDDENNNIIIIVIIIIKQP